MVGAGRTCWVVEVQGRVRGGSAGVPLTKPSGVLGLLLTPGCWCCISAWALSAPRPLPTSTPPPTTLAAQRRAEAKAAAAARVAAGEPEEEDEELGGDMHADPDNFYPATLPPCIMANKWVLPLRRRRCASAAIPGLRSCPPCILAKPLLLAVVVALLLLPQPVLLAVVVLVLAQWICASTPKALPIASVTQPRGGGWLQLAWVGRRRDAPNRHAVPGVQRAFQTCCARCACPDMLCLLCREPFKHGDWRKTPFMPRWVKRRGRAGGRLAGGWVDSGVMLQLSRRGADSRLLV